jgi:hypothetical protein
VWLADPADGLNQRLVERGHAVVELAFTLGAADGVDLGLVNEGVEEVLLVAEVFAEHGLAGARINRIAERPELVLPV